MGSEMCIRDRQARREALDLTEEDEEEGTRAAEPAVSELFGEEADIPAMDSEGQEIPSLERTVVDEPELSDAPEDESDSEEDGS